MRCISSACPRATPRWRRQQSIWRRRRRATPSTMRTIRRPQTHQNVAEPVPLHLRNAPTRLMKELEYGKGYKYAHNEPDAVADMSCLPPALEGRTYYEPTDRGFEKEIKRRLDLWREIKKRSRGTTDY